MYEARTSQGAQTNDAHNINQGWATLMGGCPQFVISTLWGPHKYNLSILTVSGLLSIYTLVTGRSSRLLFLPLFCHSATNIKSQLD